MISSVKPETHSEKHRLLQLKLDQDQKELEILQASLTRTGAFADKVSDILSSIDQRLSKLETVIIPIHTATQRLAKTEERVRHIKDNLENVISLFDVCANEESTVNAGVINGDLESYIECLKRIGAAIDKLQETKSASADASIIGLKELQKRAFFNLDKQFKEWLVAISDQPQDIADRGDYVISEDLMKNLILLSRYLASSMTSAGAFSNFPEIYKAAREKFVVNSLKEIYKAAKDQEHAFNLRSTRYEKGSTLIIPYYKRLSGLMNKEKNLILTFFGSVYSRIIYGSLLAKCIEMFLEPAESALTRTRKSLQKKEYGEISILLDIWEAIQKDSAFDTLEFGNIGPKGNEILSYKNSLESSIVTSMTTFINELNLDPNKVSALASDATIHEITSASLNILKRLLEYHDPISLILKNSDDGSFINISTFSHLASRVIEGLLIDIEIKAKGYRKNVFSAVFLLNNYHYISKSLKTSELKDFIDPQILVKLDKLFAKQMDLYRSNWITCVNYLMDPTNVQNGTIVNSLTSKQREDVKERFKGFNESFDDFLKTSSAYSVPDLELRSHMVTDIKSILLPMYDRFYDRYNESSFSKNPEKYIKYKKEGITSILSKLYEENRT